jgi:uncharacterized RDD family membrane protein YckC
LSTARKRLILIISLPLRIPCHPSINFSCVQKYATKDIRRYYEKSTNLVEGIYYAPKAYASLIRRFVIIAIDIAAIGICGLLTYPLLVPFCDTIEELRSNIKYVILVIAYLYLVFLKRTNFGTLGYWLFNAKIVNLQGKRPTIWQMTLRFILLILGPFHPILDFFWLGGDENRQTLRDKIVGTYVVEDGAVPAGRGKIIYVQYFLLTLSVSFREVKRN